MWLFLRGYCGKELDNPDEVRFLGRLNDEKSDEHRLFNGVVDFAVRYGETY